MRARRADALKLLALTVVDRSCHLVVQQTDIAKDDAERCAEFVGHGREEVLLRLVRRLGFATRGVSGGAEGLGTLGGVGGILARRLGALQWRFGADAQLLRFP